MTLPEVMRALGEQTGGLVPMGQLMPPGCEHELCSFHGSFIRMDDGTLKPVTGKAGGGCCSGSADRGVTRTVSLVASQWGPPETGVPWDGPHTLPGGLAPMAPPPSGLMDLDTFLEQARTRSFTISCMAFQDGWNLDLRRLRKCCISVVAPDGRLVPFCAYNLTGTTGERLYGPAPGGHDREDAPGGVDRRQDRRQAGRSPRWGSPPSLPTEQDCGDPAIRPGEELFLLAPFPEPPARPGIMPRRPLSSSFHFFRPDPG